MRVVGKSKELRDFIVNAIPDHPKDVVAHSATKFGLTRQAINRHMNSLMGGGRLAPPVVYCQGWSVLTGAGHAGQPDERKRLPPYVP
jgi:hypothetical protein